MLYNFDFEIASLVITVAVMTMYLLRRGYRSRCSGIFLMMVTFNLLSSLFNIATAFTISFPFAYPLWQNWLCNSSFLLWHNLTGVLFFVYVCYLVKGGQRIRWESYVWTALGVILTVLLVTTPWTGAVFYFDASRVYTHGPLFPLLYVAGFAMLVGSVFMAVRYRKRLSSYQLWAMLFYVVLVIGSMVLHLLFPNVMLEGFAVSLAFCLIYMTTENPAHYMYRQTYCYNQQALKSFAGKAINDGKPFVCVAFPLEQGRVLSRPWTVVWWKN